MPTIAFSDAFMSGSASTFMGRMMTYNLQDSSSYGLLPAGGSGFTGFFPAAYLAIMKGTVPSNFTSLTSYTSRSADELCSWWVTPGTGGPSHGFGNYFTPTASTVNANPNTIETIYNSATASGTATWFWWMTRGYRGYTASFGNSSWNDTLSCQIIGTIGTIGSGSDLELPSTSITSGQLLRIVNLRLQLPSTYVY